MSAMARPIPRPPPVTNTFFPFRSCDESAEQHSDDMVRKSTSSKHQILTNDFIATLSVHVHLNFRLVLMESLVSSTGVNHR
mmetsp:Transcript_21337/g.43901  ORF Transcript_21337/g.43901 Transcript_21337/m.43901 type:complete len:81 (+) Transcript_21337:1138-1380(+)